MKTQHREAEGTEFHRDYSGNAAQTDCPPVCSVRTGLCRKSRLTGWAADALFTFVPDCNGGFFRNFAFMGIMARRRKRQGISIHIDEWTNSIVEIKTGKVFETILIGLNPTDARQIVERDWTFSWRVEIIEAQYEFYKLTTFENKRQIQGLISLRNQEGFIEVVNVEVAKINRGNNRIYKGIGTNLFDFACKLSKERGLGGFVGFVSKSNLISHYIESLGAKVLAGQRMAIDDVAAEKLINFYFP